MHEADAVSLANLPLSHGVHVSAAEGAQRPLGQSLHLGDSSALYVPGSQSWHEAAPKSLYSPYAHASHLVEPVAPANLPAVQFRQNELPDSGWYVPDEHAVQEAEAGSMVISPALHLVHLDERVVLQLPAEQSEQLTESLRLYVPALQPVHVEAATDTPSVDEPASQSLHLMPVGEYLPVAHGTHSWRVWFGSVSYTHLTLPTTPYV